MSRRASARRRRTGRRRSSFWKTTTRNMRPSMRPMPRWRRLGPTTELALAGTPMVVGYRVGSLTYALASLIMNVRYITLVNVLLGREAVPEFVQSRCTPQNLSDAVIELLTDKGAALHERADLDEAAVMLGKGGEAPSLRAARAILEFVGTNRPSP